MAKTTPSRAKNTIITIIALILIGVYVAVQESGRFGLDFFYGQWGAYLMGVLAAAIASVKKRNPVAWFCAGVWFVLATVIVAIIIPKLHERLCPHCQEGVAAEAIVCPHCHRDLTNSDGPH